MTSISVGIDVPDMDQGVRFLLGRAYRAPDHPFQSTPLTQREASESSPGLSSARFKNAAEISELSLYICDSERWLSLPLQC
jgi:hypothetical protein